MKFSEEEARQELTKRFNDKGEKIDLSRTISESVTQLYSILKDNEEMSVKDFCSLAEKQVTTAVGLMRHETAEVAKSYQEKIKELEDKNKGNEDGKGKPNDDHTDNTVLETLRKEVEELKQEREEQKQKALISTKINEIKSSLKEKGVKNSQWVDTILSKANITSETDVEKEANDYLEMYNKFVSSSGVDDDNPPAPGGGSGKKATDAFISALKNK